MRQLMRRSGKRALYDLLTSVPGVGPLFAFTLIGNLRELGTLSRREVARLVGFASKNRDSGRRRGHRFVLQSTARIDLVVRRTNARHP
jgi:transposase